MTAQSERQSQQCPCSESIELLNGLPASGRSVDLARELCRTLGDPALREENEFLRLRLKAYERASQALLDAHDKSGLVDVVWFTPYVEALRAAGETP